MNSYANKPPKRPKGSYSMRVQGGGRITIPAEIREYFGIKPGARVVIYVRGNYIYLKKG